MTILLILKSAIVIFFLLMFLRRPRATWGIGLLSITTAVLLDTFLGTFGRDQMMSELGFFFYFLTGVLFGGGAVWAWGVLLPLTRSATAAQLTAQAPIARGRPVQVDPTSSEAPSGIDPNQPTTAFDRQMIYDDIRNRFGREDLLDLIFDMSINETDVMTLDQDMNQLIVNVMDLAAQRNQIEELALAVERILTPLPAANLPRLEKMTSDSPPTVLRHYLLAHYDMAWLQKTAFALGIDWEQLGAGGKQERVRNLLFYLYRRNRIDELIDQMQEPETNQAEN
jgi:hypothetical protein